MYHNREDMLKVLKQLKPKQSKVAAARQNHQNGFASSKTSNQPGHPDYNQHYPFEES